MHKMTDKGDDYEEDVCLLQLTNLTNTNKIRLYLFQFKVSLVINYENWKIII